MNILVGISLGIFAMFLLILLIGLAVCADMPEPEDFDDE